MKNVKFKDWIELDDCIYKYYWENDGSLTVYIDANKVRMFVNILKKYGVFANDDIHAHLYRDGIFISYFQKIANIMGASDEDLKYIFSDDECDDD